VLTFSTQEGEWKEQREQLEATIEELQSEIETLAESNSQLTSAMEELGQGASGVLESRDMQGNLGKLESALQKALEQNEQVKKTKRRWLFFVRF
jgi:predicted  nucleic acid-binding Zn-ribbon protein